MAESESNGANILTGMPIWVRAIVLFGFPTMLAAFLVWRLTDGIEQLSQQTSRQVQEHSTQVDQHVRETRDAFGRMGILLDRQTIINRQICINTARTDDQRRSCLQ